MMHTKLWTNEAVDFKTLFEILPGYLYYVDRNLTVLGCNNAFADLLRYQDKQDVLGCKLPELFSELKHSDEFIKQTTQCIQNVISSTTALSDVETPHLITSHEREFYFIANFTPVPQEDGAITVLALLTDITSRKIAEKLLFESKERIKKQRNTTQTYLDNILNNLPAYIYWKDKNSVILGCNDRLAESVGYKQADDVIGKTDYDFSWRDQAENIRKNDQEVMISNQSIIMEERGKLSDGREIIGLSHKAPMHDKQGNVIGVMGISIDITARKQAEEREKVALSNVSAALAKAEAEKDLRQAVMILTGSIVHDLRTPITTVDMIGTNIEKYLPELAKGYQEAVKHKLIQKPLKLRKLKFIESMGTSLSTISKNMNDFVDTTLKTLSKTLTEELTEDDLVICSMDWCIQQTLRRYPFADTERNYIHLVNSIDFHFMGNAILMIRILTNLIKNALYQIRTNKKGQIFISSESHDNMNILIVKDTAGGAPKEQIDNLFESYQTTKSEGTGVGLAFCKKTMKDFGGDITCESVYGDYIEFKMTFPSIIKNL